MSSLAANGLSITLYFAATSIAGWINEGSLDVA